MGKVLKYKNKNETDIFTIKVIIFCMAIAFLIMATNIIDNQRKITKIEERLNYDDYVLQDSLIIEEVNNE